MNLTKKEQVLLRKQQEAERIKAEQLLAEKRLKVEKELVYVFEAQYKQYKRKFDHLKTLQKNELIDLIIAKKWKTLLEKLQSLAQY